MLMAPLLDSCYWIFFPDYSVFSETSLELVCNTEKDKGRLRHRTSGQGQCLIKELYQCWFYVYIVGILAGIRPCGIIVLLSELFTSESKAQVYASLHQFLKEHPQVSETIGIIRRT